MFNLNFNFFLASLSRLILYVLGWRDIDSHHTSYQLQRSVLLYPHSSYFDYIFFLLYSTAYPENFQSCNFYVLMSERYSWLFFWNPSIISTPDKFVRYLMETENLTYNQAIIRILKNGFLSFLFPKCSQYKLKCLQSKTKYNFVQKVCDKLSLDNNFVLLISPTGSLTDQTWKSGYRHIANTLNCKIVSAGINYKNKTCQIISVLSAYNACEEYLKEAFEIVGRKDNYGLVDWPTFSSFLGSCILVPYMFEISDMVGLSSLFMSFVSFVYHYTHENCCVKLDLVSALSFISYIFYYKTITLGTVSVLNCLMCCSACFFLGRSWNSTRPRKNNYEVNHSLFHIFIAIAVSMMMS